MSSALALGPPTPQDRFTPPVDMTGLECEHRLSGDEVASTAA